MKTYIEETIQLYVKRIREYVVPAMQALFYMKESKSVNDKMKFHSIVTKLLYLGKRGRPEILMLVQFLCTRVKCGWHLCLPPHGVHSSSKFNISVSKIICLLRRKSWYTHGKRARRQPLGSKKKGNSCSGFWAYCHRSLYCIPCGIAHDSACLIDLKTIRTHSIIISLYC
jgi:hypothetical protein